MRIRGLLCASVFVILFMKGTESQEVPIPQLSPGSSRKSAPIAADKPTPPPPQSIALNRPRGTPLQVALDHEVRLKKVGQPIHARIAEPVYAFDRIVVPVGSEVTGEVRKIGAI